MKKQIKKIGWLDSANPFLQGNISPTFVDKLIKILNRERVNLLRGIKKCPLCSNIVYAEGFNKGTLGISQIWVPDMHNSNIVYAAPDFIIHYVKDHKYCPPQEFIESVMAFDLNSDWSGEEIFNEIRR